MRRLIITAIIGLAVCTIMGTGCDANDPASTQREQSIQSRTDTFQRAQDKYPLPTTTNFPLRQMLVEMTKREDLVNHPWYIYVLGNNGNTIGYYVGKTVPINSCDFLSTTQNVVENNNNNDTQVLQAPSIDGIYYGNSSCNEYVFEDYSTDALIKIGNVKYYVADKPLNLQAQAIKVTSKRG